jgi:hypothetical protein
MLPQPITDALIVFGMFVVRVGLPVFILFGLAAWLQKKLQPRETEETERRTVRARIIPFSRSTAQTPSAQTPQQRELDTEQGDKAARA